MANLGYACINMSMGKKVGTNRTMVKRTFEAKGLDYVSDLALLNAKDIIKILEWNRLNGINFFRLSSALVPWGDGLDLTQLKDYKEIKSELKKAGDYAKPEFNWSDRKNWINDQNAVNYWIKNIKPSQYPTDFSGKSY